MPSVSKFGRIANRILRWPLDLSDEDRQHPLLNMLLLIVAAAAISLLMTISIYDLVVGVTDRTDYRLLWIGTGAILASSLFVFVLNRFSSRLAAWFFVLLMPTAIIVGSTPAELAAGRGLIVFAVLVVMASAILRPLASLLLAVFCSLTTVVAAHIEQVQPPISGIISLLVVALTVVLLVQILERTLNHWRVASKNLALLNQASRALSSSLDLDRVLVTVLDEVRRLLDIVASSVWLIDPLTDELVCRQATGDQSDQVRGWRMAPGQGIAGWVAQSGKSHIVSDTWQDRHYYKGVDLKTGLGLRSILTVPLRVGRGVIGVLQIVDSQVNRFHPSDLDLLEPLAAAAASAVENARLYAGEQQRATALAEALDKQQELDRLKSEFIQNVSHELRTPLALISGYAELLDGGVLGPLGPEQQEPIAVIVRRTRFLTRLVDDLTTILAVESHELRRVAVRLDQLVRDRQDEFQAAARQAGISFEIVVPPALPTVDGDPDHLGRVVDNLVNNAFKFTPAGGSVTVQLAEASERVLLQVTDTGIGISPDQVDRIFDRFYQVDGSMSRRYGGTGLGLALVKEVVATHGGTVDVESTLGAGSTFRVSFPRSNKQ